MSPVRHIGLPVAGIGLVLLTLLSACGHQAERANPIDPQLTPPVELTATTSDTAGAALLSWTRYEGLADFAAYLVLRNEVRSTDVDTVARLADIAQTAWIDSTVATGRAFQYRLGVLHGDGHVSTGTPRSVPALQLPPVRIEALAVNSRTASAQLTWSRYQGPRFEAYEIRRTTGNETVVVQEVEAINDTTHTDTRLLGATTYSYAVAVRTTRDQAVESALHHVGFHDVVNTWDLGFTISNVDDDFIRLSVEEGALRALIDRSQRGVRLVQYGFDGSMLSETVLLERPTSRSYPNYAPRARTTSSSPAPTGERWVSVLSTGGAAQGVIRIGNDGALVRDRFEMRLPAASAVPSPVDSGSVDPGVGIWLNELVVHTEDGIELMRSEFQGPAWGSHFPERPWEDWKGPRWGAFSISACLIGVGANSPLDLRMGESRLLLRLLVNDPKLSPLGTGTARLIWIDGSGADSTEAPYPAYDPLTMPVRMGFVDGVPTATLEPPAFAHRRTEAAGAFWATLVNIDGTVAHTAGGHAFVIDPAGGSQERAAFNSSVSELRVWQLTDERVPRMAACLPEANQVAYGTVPRADRWREQLRDTMGPRFEPDGPSLFYPLSMAAGPDGRMYVLDAGNARIVVFDRDGRFITHFGTHGTGPGQFNFGSEEVIQDGRSFAGSIAVGEDGTIYVADTGNGRIQVFSP